MSIKSDRWIRRMAVERGMIEPFVENQVPITTTMRTSRARTWKSCSWPLCRSWKVS